MLKIYNSSCRYNNNMDIMDRMVLTYFWLKFIVYNVCVCVHVNI